MRVQIQQAAEKSPQPAPLLLSPPGQGEKIEEGSHPFGCAQDKLLCRVLLPSVNPRSREPVFPHPASRRLSPGGEFPLFRPPTLPRLSSTAWRFFPVRST